MKHRGWDEESPEIEECVLCGITYRASERDWCPSCPKPETIGGALWLVSQRISAGEERKVQISLSGDARATLSVYEPSDRDREILAAIQSKDRGPRG